MRTKANEKKLEIQTICDPLNGSESLLSISDIQVDLSSQSPVREQYYTGTINAFLERGKIQVGDRVTICKTATLEKGCYVAVEGKSGDPGTFGLFIFEGYDKEKLEYLFDDPTYKKTTVKRIGRGSIKSAHRIIHVIKIEYVDDL